MWIKLLPCFTQTWNILFIQTVVLSLFTNVSSIFSLKLPDVYWSRTNSMFKISNNLHIIEVNMNDEMNFVCPYYSDTGLDPKHHEYYIIHRVTQSEYENCHIDDSSPAVALISCNKPHKALKYTLTFASFLPIPDAIEFTQGETYYFISTSTGEAAGLNNSYKGACYENNMKLTIRVCCDQTSQSCVPAEVPGCCSCAIINHTVPATPSPTTKSSSSSHHALASTTTSSSSTVAPSTTTVTTTTTTQPTTTRRRATTTTRAQLRSSTAPAPTRRAHTTPRPGPTVRTTSPGDRENEVDPGGQTTNKHDRVISDNSVIHKHSSALLFTGLLFTLLNSLLVR